MNEHQYDHNLDFHNNDYASSEQHLSSDFAGDYNQELLTEPTNVEQSWSQEDHTDYTQSDFNVAEDYYSSSYGEMEMLCNSYGSDLSDLNGSNDYIQYDSVSYEQSTYSIEQTSFDNALETQDYDSNLWSQQYQEQSASSYNDVSFDQQRSGHEPTAEDLAKANELDAQAREEETHYQDDTRWAKNHENHPDAHIYFESAAKHKKKKKTYKTR